MTKAFHFPFSIFHFPFILHFSSTNRKLLNDKVLIIDNYELIIAATEGDA